MLQNNIKYKAVKSEIINRKGARKLEDIPEEVLELLNLGKIETVNLSEWLAIDHVKLIKSNFPALGIADEVIQSLEQKMIDQKKPSAMNTIKLVGAGLYQHYINRQDYTPLLDTLGTHLADSIRCYAPYLISLNEQLNVEEKLIQSEKLVADPHFGVREVVWMALRPSIDKNLASAILFLSNWAENPDENIRRFTSEVSRPRGVWCKHIEALKEKPALALAILEKLKADPSKYVQDSVGNWLNDASKSQPDFVIALCERWKAESPVKATEKIIKRARRTIDKK